MMTAALLPNILSIARIGISPVLLIIEPATAWFFSVYFICGLTDVLDGYLARKLGVVSKLGKTLDLVGDTVFTLVLLVLFFLNFLVPIWLIVWVLGIAVLRIAAWSVSYYRLKVTFSHTYLDRIAGVSLFWLLPVLFLFPPSFTAACIVACTIATLATLDIFAISVLMKKASTSVFSVFQIKDSD